MGLSPARPRMCVVGRWRSGHEVRAGARDSEMTPQLLLLVGEPEGGAPAFFQQLHGSATLTPHP